MDASVTDIIPSDAPAFLRFRAGMYPAAGLTFEPVTKGGLCTAFRTALLLTGNAKQAEAAILDAICSADREEISDQKLFLGAVSAALAWREAPSETDGSSSLPLELRSVLRLSMGRRHCFVLRFLAGFSREKCSQLLHLDIRQVDERASAAAQELALAR
jgi:hypothetical protein